MSGEIKEGTSDWLPWAAPSMIPGKSSSCMFAPLYYYTQETRHNFPVSTVRIDQYQWKLLECTSMTPGMQVRVVNSYDAHAL